MRCRDARANRLRVLVSIALPSQPHGLSWDFSLYSRYMSHVPGMYNFLSCSCVFNSTFTMYALFPPGPPAFTPTLSHFVFLVFSEKLVLTVYDPVTFTFCMSVKLASDR